MSALNLTLVSFLLLSCSVHSNKKILTYPVGTDFHMHIHSPPKEYDDMQFNASRALFAADCIELKRALVISGGYAKQATKEWAQRENNFIQTEVSKLPHRLTGACAVNPLKTWAVDEVKRCSEMGLKVLKLHFMASGMDLKKAEDYQAAKGILTEAGLYQMTVLVHAHYPQESRGDEIEKLKSLIEAFPNIRFIIGHLFGRDYQRLESLQHSNFVVEISAAPIFMKSETEKTQLVESMRKTGMEKFVFGSDWPVFHPAEMLKALKALPLSEHELEQILFLNAGKLNDLFAISSDASARNF